MPLQTLTVNGNSVVAVPLPHLGLGAAKLLEFSIADAVAVVSSVYTGESQSQTWPGADMWSVKVTLPPVQDPRFAPWRAWLMQMRGQLRAVQIADPTYPGPRGNLRLSTPLIDSSGSGTNLAGATTLHLKGFAASTYGVLLPGDRIQVGYRLHEVLDQANSDGGGKTSFEIWPSLREAAVDGATPIFANPQGLFRLASNQRAWSRDLSRANALSFALTEYRGNGNS